MKKELVSFLYKPDGISGTKGGTRPRHPPAAPYLEIPASGGGAAYDPNTGFLTGGGAQETAEKDKITDPKIGQVLKVNRRVSSLAEAEEVAKAALRSSNMRQIRGTLTFMGNPLLHSGANATVEGFGRWDSGLYQVEEVTHSYSVATGYTTSAELRGVLFY